MMTPDTVAWLREVYVELSLAPAFATYAIPQQFNALVTAVATTDPARAHAMRRWSPADQSACLAALWRLVDEKPLAPREELWAVRLGDRALRCIAVHLADGGIDLRLLEGDDFRRTIRCESEVSARAQADAWRDKLAAVGWQWPT